MKNNIDIYFVHLFNDFSGSPRVLKDVIDLKLNPKGQTFVFTSKHQGFLSDTLGVKKTIFYRRSKFKFLQLVFYFLSQGSLFFKLSFYCIKSRLSGRKPLILANTMLPFSALLAGYFTNSRTVCYVHETLIKPEIFKNFLRFFIEHFSDNVIYVSKFLMTAEPFERPVSEVIYNGLRKDFGGAVDQLKKFNNKTILFAGSLKSYKGIYELIKISRKLETFNFTAAVNCTESELADFLRLTNVPSNLKFYARPESLDELFSESFAVLNLSIPGEWEETFGLSIIEGMSYSTPVVVPPVGGPAEIVNSTFGALIDSRCTMEVVDFINYLNSDYEVWLSYSNCAFQHSKKFTSENFRKNFSDYYNNNLGLEK